MRLAPIVALSLILAIPASAEPEPIASVTPPPELARVLRDYEQAWQARDAAALAALFAPDGFVLANGRPPVRGRDAIVEAYRDAGGGLALRALSWGIDGATGYIVGGFAAAAGEPDIGKFVLVVRKGTEGRWEIVADIDNMNRRPGPPAEVPSSGSPH